MRFYLSVFLFLVAVVSFSCSKKISENIDVQEEIVLEKFIPGKVLSKSANLCLYGRDNEMHSVLRLNSGAEILVLEIDGNIDTKNTESAEYVHVIYDTMDFWLNKSVFAMNCNLGVVIEKSFLYADSSLSQKNEDMQEHLKFGTAVAISTLDESLEDGKNEKSKKIFYYDSNLKSVKEAYISSSSVSTREDDIVVSQVVESLKVTTRAVPRNELFAKAARYNPSAKVLAALNEQKIEKKSYNYQEVVNSLKTIKSGVNVNELLTVDQSKDPFR